MDLRKTTGHRVESVTGEIDWDYGRGVVRIDAPFAQGAVGFLQAAGMQHLRHVQIDCRNEYAAIVLVALDDKPLAESGRVLVQIGTEARPTGWKTEPVTSTTRYE